MTNRELALELEPILTELEMAAEKTEVMLWDLNEHYFAEPEPSLTLLSYYYKQMGIRSSIARDYLLELFDKVEELKGIVKEFKEIDVTLSRGSSF